MPRSGIGYSDVATAAQIIADDGIVPTIERIRQRLGGGNNTNIGNHLKAWKATQSSDGRIVPVAGVPPLLTKVVQELWQTLEHDTQQRINTIEQEAKTVVDASAAEVVNMRQNNMRLTQQVNDLEENRHQIEASQATLAKQLQEQLHANALLTEKQHGLQEQLIEQQAENARLHSFGQHMQQSLVHYQEQQQQLKQQEALAQQTLLLTHTHEVKELREQLLQEGLQRQQWHNTAIALQSAQQQLTIEHDTVSNQHQTLQQQVTSQEATISHLQQQLSEQIADYQQQLTRYQTENQQLAAQLAVANHEQQRLLTVNDQSKHTIELLRADKLTLTASEATLKEKLSQKFYESHK